jgi:hypothetical protein
MLQRMRFGLFTQVTRRPNCFQRRSTEDKIEIAAWLSAVLSSKFT